MKLVSFLQDSYKFPTGILCQVSYLKITKVLKETYKLLIRSYKVPAKQLQKACKYLSRS